MAGFGKPANKKASKSARKPQLNCNKWFNQAIYSHQTGRLREAELIYKKLIDAGISDPAVFCNLGIICKDSGRSKEALDYYEQATKIAPEDPKIYSNIGNLYSEIGDLKQALQFTLKSIDLEPDSSTVQMNLGNIYRDLGHTDHALSATLKSIELDEDNLEALQNLKSLVSNLQISPSNREDTRNAYGILLNRNDFFHRKLCPLFIQEYLETIRIAANAEPIISEKNHALDELAADWRFTQSLTLLIPPHQEIETFLTRLRKEFLSLATKEASIPPHLRPLLEGLASQCFLNEYIYWQSDEEQQAVRDLTIRISENQIIFNQTLPVVSCYTPIHAINIREEYLSNYPKKTNESRALLETLFKEVRHDKEIKARLGESRKHTNPVSVEVQGMYEENPYPRYRYADYTHPDLTQPIHDFIQRETTMSQLSFNDELVSNNYRPKVLIAGCGTGNQIINASRYKNTDITAIDLSKTSLAYAARKAQEYNMNHIRLEQIDILDANKLQQNYDVIECSGVLHHMENPAQGLAALNRQLKTGGFIKIGLYSALARRHVSSARHLIQKLGLKGTPEEIRNFRKNVFEGEHQEIEHLSKGVNDFYSLSECRDLCFHVQEHQFTINSLRKLLEAENLVFCGFMLPDSIQMAYQQSFPTDADGDSFENWEEFEQKNQSTFQSMYQFWAYKP